MKKTKAMKNNLLQMPALAKNQPVNVMPLQKRICVAVPTTGTVRIEWVMSRFGVTVPVNWSHGDFIYFYDQYSPKNYVVADARNICVEYSISEGFEWTFFLDHDVMLPADTFIKLNKYMTEMEYPIVSGLYYCKGSHPEPLVFRGRGNGYYGDWKFGDKFFVDGIPMGLCLIHNSILKAMYDESETYTVQSIMGPVVVRRVFETPRSAWRDTLTGKYISMGGTEDLPFFERILRDNILKKAGWDKIAKKKYPYLVDSTIFAKHIDTLGMTYPSDGYLKQLSQYKGSKLEKMHKQGLNVVAKSAGSQYGGDSK